MREPLRDPERLRHILEAIKTIQRQSIQEWEKQIFSNPIVFYGLTKLVEIIGEAAWKLTKEFRSLHPEVEWEDIMGMRHILVHDYYTISPKILLEVVRQDIPNLKNQIEQLLGHENCDTTGDAG